MQLVLDFSGYAWLFLAFLLTSFSLIIFSNRLRDKIERTTWLWMIRMLRLVAVTFILLILFDPQLGLSIRQEKPKRIAILHDLSRSMDDYILNKVV